MDDIKTGEIIDKPKRHRPKQDHLSVKRRRGLVVKGVMEGKTDKEICEETGMSVKNPHVSVNQVLRHPETQVLFSRVLEKYGVSDERIAQKISDLLDAKKSVFAQKDGVFTDERIIMDTDNQRKTAELAARLKGHLKNDDKIAGDVSIGLMAVVVNALQVNKE